MFPAVETAITPPAGPPATGPAAASAASAVRGREGDGTREAADRRVAPEDGQGRIDRRRDGAAAQRDPHRLRDLAEPKTEPLREAVQARVQRRAVPRAERA